MLLKLFLVLAGISGALCGFLSPSNNRQIRAANRLCKYGNRYDCCRGYTKNLYGQCIPKCDQGCENGKCIGHNRCRCNAGFTGPKCDRDYNECSATPCSHRCMNTYGSYRCYCEHGYLLMPDGKTCTKDDRCHMTRCSFGCVQHSDGFSCFCPDGFRVSMDGLGCEDVDECKEGNAKCPNGRRCQNTYGNFICLCPEGFKFQYVNRRFECVEDSACDASKCDTNAQCKKVNGVFKCACNEGFIGNGEQCRPLDSTTCRDGPCYPGVECIDIIDFRAGELGLTPEGAVKQFRCGSCPEGFLGTGEACAPTTTEMKVVVFESFGNQDPLADADVKLLEVQSPGVTERYAAAQTDSKGVAALRVPNDPKLFVLTASKQDYLETAKRYDSRPNEENVIVLFCRNLLKSMISHIRELQGFEFGGAEGSNNFRLGVPQGALNVRQREKIAVRLLDIDISDPTSLANVPELVGIKSEGGQVREVQLEVFGIAELTMFSHKNGEPPELNSPVIIEFPMDNYKDRFVAGQQIEAWYFDIDRGYWIQDGFGTLQQRDVGFVWTYEASHFTWWSAAEAIEDYQCITAKACFDSLCTKPALGIRFQLTGLGYNFFSAQTTSSSGEVSFKFRHDSIARVSQNCTGEHRTVSGGQKLGSLGATGPCEELVFLVPGHLNSKCPDPGNPENGARQGDTFTYGNAVSYFCDPEYSIHGSSSRVCLECSKWSGYRPYCESADYSSSLFLLPRESEGSGNGGTYP
ncbi:LOW QUALITY PROTEIN: uncharacterized protein [Amphiura filiformis]|uniref:LOW QUALITY PROTEIN: uncharacterized protein n=1 Tax=Amphiura filiformis TaxID=82378 RepID=UPI003B2187E6